METSPRFSIIIPARNEEKYLPRCLESINRETAGRENEVEVIVVLNRSDDRTEEIARAGGCRIVRNESKNLSKIRNAGAAAARGQVFVTIDADSQMSHGLFRKIERKLHCEHICGGGTVIVPDRISPGIVLTFLMLVPIALYYRISGGLYFCRRAAFEAIGGFNEELVSVEDIDFARRLRAYAKKSGFKFVNLYTSYVVTSTRKFDQFGDWFYLKNFRLTLKLFRGRDQEAADKVWYDVDR